MKATSCSTSLGQFFSFPIAVVLDLQLAQDVYAGMGLQ